MKNTTIILCMLFCFSMGFEANAQLSKKEAKEWKKRKKSLSIEEFKKIVEENSSVKGQISSLNGQVSSLQSRVADKDSEINRLKNELSSARAAVNEKKPEPSEPTDNSTRVARGVVFKVQIGAFRNKDLSKYFNNDGDFSGEDADGVQKYTLGSFRDYWEADTFKKYLREMGVKDAWIVPYKDGVRVPIKDVLEGIVN
ncbi:Ezrin/radixin/moesin family protein [Fulvivirgaceae bacterium BMA10]|uniref:Ezrin/radixin/moesin family protein n=1 Tax=Splendidivirga corallicola TaxID=3051826 RepID=A0ABT8KLR0_9BACT|nr:Ezrin/radixin/moesin family protein [Fulvivirgaceae bacterium BMA10]